MSDCSNDCAGINQEFQQATSTEEWYLSPEELASDFSPDIDYGEPQPPANTTVLHSVRSLFSFMFIFLLLWSSFYGISYRAMEHLIRFIRYFAVQLANVVPGVAPLLDLIPKILYLLRKIYHLHSDNFKKYIICENCSSLYKFDDCYEHRGGRYVPKLCCFVPYPYHPNKSRRKPCNHPLLKTVILKGGTEKLYPLKVYCYKSLKDQLTDILIRPAMIENCNNWRSRVVPEGYLCDVYDGKVWNDFVANGFFDEGNNIALMMNCDWFQPYKLTQYSVGVFYFVIMNLPRNIRFKRENLIIAGIIPGPTEPSY